MIDTAKLKEKILDLAIRGKLVPQDPNDEPASVLLEKIRAEKLQMVKEGKLKQKDIKDDTVIFVGEDNLHYEKFADGSIKCIEDEIPFEIPKSWVWCRINTISKNIFAGGDKPSVCVKIQSNDCNIPIYSNGIENNGLYGFTDKAKVDEPSITISARGTIGFCCVREKPFVPIVRLITIIPCNQINVFYLSYVFNKLTSNGKGSSIPQLTVPDVKPKLIPLPPTKEMNKIVDCITNTLLIIQKINKEEAEIKNISNLLKSKILDLAIRGKLVPQDPNDEPADALLERIRKEKEELIKQGKIKRDKKESIIFKGDDNSYYVLLDGITYPIEEYMQYSLPKGWSWICLKDIASITSGKTPSMNYITEEGQIPYYKISDMNTEGNEVYLDKTTSFLNEKYDGVIFNKGSFVFPKNGGAVLTNKKRILLYDSLVDLNTGVITFSPIIDANYAFLMFSFIDFSKLYKGSTIPTVDSNIISNLIFALPPINEQKRIVKVVEKTYDLIDKIELSIN